MGIINSCKFNFFLTEIKKIIHPFGQITVVILFSLLPLFLTALSIASQPGEKTFFSEVIKLLENGSIFIYVSTFLAP